MVMAALLFIRRVADTTTVEIVSGEDIEDGRAHMLQDKDIPDYVTIVRIHGPLLFGTTDKIDELHKQIDRLAPVVLLRMRDMTALDATGLTAIEELADRLHASGRHLLLCGARPQPARLLHRADFHEHVGVDNLLPDVEEALERARVLFESGLARRVR